MTTKKKPAAANSGKAKPKNTAKAAHAAANKASAKAKAAPKKPLARSIGETMAEAAAEDKPAAMLGGAAATDGGPFIAPPDATPPPVAFEAIHGEPHVEALQMFINGEQAEETECEHCRGIIDLSVVWHGHTATCIRLKARLKAIEDREAVAFIVNKIGAGGDYAEPTIEDRDLAAALGLRFEFNEEDEPGNWFAVPEGGVALTEEQREREREAIEGGALAEDEDEALPDDVERLGGDAVIEALRESASGEAPHAEPEADEAPAPARASTVNGVDAAVKTWIEQREVRHVFTDEDKQRSALRLLDLMTEIEGLEQEKKTEVARIKSEIEKRIGELKAIRSAARDGYEKAKVNVIVKIDVHANRYSVTREDNGEVLQSRELNADEKQLRFNI